jgi:hypothetical protein
MRFELAGVGNVAAVWRLWNLEVESAIGREEKCPAARLSEVATPLDSVGDTEI